MVGGARLCASYVHSDLSNGPVPPEDLIDLIPSNIEWKVANE